MMQAWSKSLFMAHRTDPAVLSGITTNPTCIKTRQTTQVHHFIQKIFCWDTSKPRAFLWCHVLLCFWPNSTDHCIFSNPYFPNKLSPIPTEGQIDIFIPSLLNKHSSQTYLKNTALLWALLWMTVQAQAVFWAEQVFPFKHISWDWEGLLSLEMAVSSHWGRRKLWFMLQEGKPLLDCHLAESPLKPNRSFMNQGESKLRKYMVSPLGWCSAVVKERTSSWVRILQAW